MRTAACLLPLLIALAAPPSPAEEEARPFSLGFEAGYRSVSVDGNLDKYREDVNLSDNALRLFSLDLDWRPAKESWLDELTLSAEGLGGEPYASARFTLRKAGLYDLKARYRSSDYFYADQGWYFREGGDLHTWNARRSFYDLDFSWHAAPWVTVRAGADRMDRSGGSTTTRDIQRDVFLLDRPVDQLASTYWVGADFRAGWANITIEERYASYESRWAMASQASSGLESGGSTLDAYRQTQDQEGDAPVTRILVSGTPLEWLRFSAHWARTDASLDYDVEGAWNGLDYDDSPAGNPPEPYATTLANSGSVDRSTDTWGADVTFAALDNLDLTVDYTRWSYDQDGNIASTEQQTGGKDAGTIGIQGEVHSSLSLDSWGIAADWRATSTLTVSAGAGFQTRTAEFPLAGPTVETKRSLYRAGARWRPNAVWDLFLQGETGTDEDPYTPVSPTDFNRIRAEVKVRPLKTLSLSARYRDETRSNGLSYPLGLPTDDTPPVSTLSGAEFSVTSWGATVDWKPIPRLALSFAYDHAGLDSDADLVYVTGSSFFPVFDIFTAFGLTDYTSDQDTFRGEARLDLGKGWSAGLLATTVENSGSFPLTWDQYRAEARYQHPAGWSARLAWDRYRLDEDNPYSGPPAAPTPDVNDYDADLVTVAFGYRF